MRKTLQDTQDNKRMTCLRLIRPRCNITDLLMQHIYVYLNKILLSLRIQLNPEKPDVPLNKNDAFQKVQKRRVQENGERGPIQHDQSPPFFFHLNPL